MIPSSLLYQIAVLILAGVPFSLIILNFFRKLFLRQHEKTINVSTICTDVVGVLTHKDLAVKSLRFDRYHANVLEDDDFLEVINNENKETLKVEKRELKKENCVELMATITALCHYPKLEKVEDVIAGFFHQCNLGVSKFKHQYEIIDHIPTDPLKKISTIVALKEETKEIFSFTKGNPKSILQQCTRTIYNGEKVEINEQMRRKLRQKIKSINKRGQKAIAFAYKGLPFKRYEKYSANFTESDLILVGIVGLGNFSNKELIPYIEELKAEKVKTYILSKTRARKAVAVGLELKMINQNYFETIEKDYLSDLTDQKLKKLLSNRDKDYIFSHLSDSDQERIIAILEELGEKVALVNNEDITLQSILQSIQDSRSSKIHCKKSYIHASSIKIITFLLILISIIFQAPPALSISGILILDLAFNLLIEFSFGKDKYAENYVAPEINYTKIIINSLIISTIISAVYFWSLTRYGWYPGEYIALGSNAYSVSTSLVFLLISTTLLLKAMKLRKKAQLFSNPYFFLVCAIIILAIYSLIKFKLLYLTNPGSADLQILAFVVLAVIISEKFIKWTYQKLTT